MSIYTNKNVDKNALKINYLICNDFALGASFFSEKNVTVKYLKKIIGRVKYAEDNIYRLMVFEGIVLHYVKKNIVWYEFGTGISTSQNRKWGRAIKKDIIATNRIMRKDMKIHNFFDFRYKFMLLAGGRIQKHLSCFFFPEGIKYFIYRKKFPVYTVTNFDLSFYKKLQVL